VFTHQVHGGEKRGAVEAFVNVMKRGAVHKKRGSQPRPTKKISRLIVISIGSDIKLQCFLNAPFKFYNNQVIDNSIKFEKQNVY